VFGDFCVDAYWLIDPDESELSVETGLPLRRVREQHYSVGGAANVAANVAALGVAETRAVSLIGEDMFGSVILGLLAREGVNTAGLIRRDGDWQTMVFGKPCVGDVEQNRIDFGGFNVVAHDMADALIAELERAACECDLVILNQQVPAGVSPPGVIERINAIVASHPECRFIVDSRDRAGQYRGAMLKLNAHEAARLCGGPRTLDEAVSRDKVLQYAARLRDRAGRAVFITRGEVGMVVADEGGIHEVPGIQVLEVIDSVGAGDTVVAAIGAALASGADAVTAARLANIAASVTIRKHKVAGTADPEEICGVGPDPDYIYLPDLADSPAHAALIEGTQIELTRPLSGKPDIRHALFDHDGTISVLRHGWEQVMEPMMVRAILGPRCADAPESLRRTVARQCHDFIDKTTGVQTLVQTAGLVKMVREFGCVPEEEILDACGYKAIYNEELLKMVRGRLAKLESGELARSDFTVKNAPALLQRLYDRGVTLHLLSGTDEEDARAEAQALGYAHLFEGRIHGAVGDVKVEAKRDVTERIILEHSLGGAPLAVFGDGPVEMREVRKRGGICVGVASDEVRRCGLNPAKRRRLIRAGADLIIPDFSRLDELLEVLGIERGNA
jgi:rfaE bifunctional protein kinase chain/domain